MTIYRGEGGGVTLPSQGKFINISRIRTYKCTKCRHIFTRTLTSKIPKCTKCRKRLCLNHYNITDLMDPVTSVPTSPNNISHPTTNPNANQGNHWIK